MKKLIIIFFGILNFITFHIAIIGLYLFLNNDRFFSNIFKLNRDVFWGDSLQFFTAILINLFLISFFTFPHTILLGPRGRKLTEDLNMPLKLHMTLYAFHASFSLILMFYFWRPIAPFFEFTGLIKILILIFQALSWLLIAWAMYATGPMKQIGMEQWWNYLKNKPLNNDIPYSGPYKFMRHPIYTAFFGMILFNPYYSVSHFILLVFWGYYLYWGARNKESRYMRNKEYQIYAKKVAFLPGLIKS